MIDWHAIISQPAACIQLPDRLSGRVAHSCNCACRVAGCLYAVCSLVPRVHKTRGLWTLASTSTST